MRTVFAAFMLALLGWLVWGVVDPSPPADPTNDPCPGANRTSAEWFAHELIRKSLSTPSTAKFPSAWSNEAQVRQVSPCTFDVKTYVDAQNLFGAMVRQHFEMRISKVPGTDTWRRGPEVLGQEPKPLPPSVRSAIPKERPLPDR